MTRVAALTRPLRGYLTERLGRLNAALSDLAGRLRTVTATRVAENVATAIREAVEEVLAGPTEPYAPSRPPYHDTHRRWSDADDPPRYVPSNRSGLDTPLPPRWADEDDAPRSMPSSKAGLFAHDPDESDHDDESEADFEATQESERDPTVASAKPALSPSPRLHAALVLSLQASVWWLRHRRRTSLLAALAVGGATGTLALLSSPLLDAGIATLRSLLVLTG